MSKEFSPGPTNKKLQEDSRLPSATQPKTVSKVIPKTFSRLQPKLFEQKPADALQQGEYLIHSKFLATELHRRIHNKSHPASEQEVKETLTRWMIEKKFETKANEDTAVKQYGYEKGSSIVECIRPDGPLTILGYMEDDKGQEYQNVIYSEAKSDMKVMDLSEKEKPRPGYTFAKDKNAWHNMEGNSDQPVSGKQGAAILLATGFTILSGGSLLVVEASTSGLLSYAVAYSLPAIGAITSVDDLIGAFKEQTNKPWNDYDSAIEFHFLTNEDKLVYTTIKIVAGGLSIKNSIDNIIETRQLPKDAFANVNNITELYNIIKDLFELKDGLSERKK